MDFRELPQDGQAFEQLIRELLFSIGLYVEWSGRGPDGGRDLLCRETLTGQFLPTTRTWLIQCKHKAHGGDSVGVNDLDDIVSSCVQHGATGYLLACTTQPSSAVVNRLEGITNNHATQIAAMYWDGVTIRRLLSQPRQWAIAQRFMPQSCGEWQIYATEAPNDFVAHYRGYVFHLSNRIGSSITHHLVSIEMRIAELEAIELPKGHFIRPRSVWYNDKSGEYVWYIDYMRPHEEIRAISKAFLLDHLKDGWALEDGQLYCWDINFVKYHPYSDHFDIDHYDYYSRYLPNFLGGTPRERDSDIEEYWSTRQELEYFEKQHRDARDSAFNAMVDAFRRVPFLKLLRAANACPELVVRLERRFDWSDLTQEIDFEGDNVFTASLVITVWDVEQFFKLLEKLPNDVGRHFRVSRVYVFLPESGLDTSEDENLFDLRLMLHPMEAQDQRSTRAAFNKYFTDITSIISQAYPAPQQV